MDKTDYARTVDTVIKLASNYKPTKYVKTGVNKVNIEIMIGSMRIELQKRLIYTECLEAAIMLSKDKKQISKNALEFLDEKIKEFANATIDNP